MKYLPALRFGFLTPLYDPIVALTTREAYVKRRLVAQASIADGSDVLDIGCGTGTLAIRVAGKSPASRVTGLDADATMLRRAQHKAAAAGVEVRLDRGLAGELPYPEATFDRVLSSLFFHHLTREQKRRTVEEILRVLRPGGELHVADWGKPTGLPMRMLFYSVQLLDGFETTADSVTGVLPELLADAGFRDVHVRREIGTPCGTLTLYSAVCPFDAA